MEDPKAGAANFHLQQVAEGFTVLHESNEAKIEYTPAFLFLAKVQLLTKCFFCSIVLVHGLGGHPYKTWACPRKNSKSSAFQQTATSGPKPPSKRRRKFRHLFRRFYSARGRKENEEREEDEEAHVYWPRDFLAYEEECKQARILTYGYDSKITRGYENANLNTFFSHAKDFLYGLRREKPPRRAVIFVAHSLGGLLVKEMLRRSEASDEEDLKDIVRSTVGVVFLGTPHRGSPGVASLGETVRRIAGTILRVDSNPSLLRALGTDSPELELGRESFLTIWRKYDIRVKTFQEAWGVAGVNLGPLNAKVVPDISSTLDDPKEHAESISANHMNMCRFDTTLNPGYRKLAAEIRSLIHSSETRTTFIGKDERAFLHSLGFAEMSHRRDNIQRALDHTCSWLKSTPQFANWVNRAHLSENHGLLWIKGKPGSGKSTLMKYALKEAELAGSGSQTTTAGFFFNARGTLELEKTPMGLYRSLLHQILQQDSLALFHLTPIYKKKALFRPTVMWHEEELQDLLYNVFATSQSRPAIIFIDAMDECNDDEVRSLVRFFKVLAKKAYEAKANLSVCFSSRHYPHISIDGCPEVVVEDNNRADILLYIVSESEENAAIKELKDGILDRSSGVFLWVVLVLAILQKHGRGKSLKFLRQKVREIPPQLDKLFRTIFSHQDQEANQQTVCLMQLMLFARTPLTLFQINLALAFGRTPYDSLKAWKDSVEYLEKPEKVHELIIDLSRGLLEEAPSSVKEEEKKGNVTYQFIHETVREFFLSGDGFKLLQFQPDSVIGSGHSMLAACCANYLATKECLASSWCGLEVFGQGPDFALLDYFSVYLFDHIEAAIQNGTSQEKVIRCLSDDSCELLRLLSYLRGKTRFVRGSTILMAAIEFEAIESARFILDMGFDVNQYSSAGIGYAIHAALSGRKEPGFSSRAHQLEMVNLLLSKGADVQLQNKFGQTALHIAATRNAATVRAVLEKHPLVNAQDIDGETPLHRAALSLEYKAIAEILVEHGAKADIKDRRGRTPLDVASSPLHQASGVQEMLEEMEGSLS